MKLNFLVSLCREDNVMIGLHLAVHSKLFECGRLPRYVQLSMADLRSNYDDFQN